MQDILLPKIRRFSFTIAFGASYGVVIFLIVYFAWLRQQVYMTFFQMGFPIVVITLLFFPVLVWVLWTFYESQQQIKALQQKVEQTRQIQHLFIKQSEHELQRPLTIARANVELLFDQPELIKSDVGRKKLQTALRVIDRLSTTLKSFRYLHTIDVGESVRLGKRSVDMAYIIESLVDEYTDMISSNVKLSYVPPAQHLNSTALLDPNAMRQLFSNLLDYRLANIEKYQQKDGEIRIHLIGTDNFIIVLINDNGPYMQQVDLMDENYLATDPNLISARKIVHAHVGTLSYVNRASAGCRIVMSFPLDPEQVAPVRFEPMRKAFSLTKLVHDTIEEYQLVAENHDVELYDLHSCDEYEYEGDKQSIREALANLIYNAIKYSKAGGHIEVRLEELKSNLVITVLDRGQGIGESYRNRIFNIGFQANPMREGSGLGLPLVKSIIESHGGTVSVKNRPIQGTKFSVHLPHL